MEFSIRSWEEFHDCLEGERQDAAEKGREEGKISAVPDLYIAGYIARDVASAQLGVKDQEFETLLQSHNR